MYQMFSPFHQGRAKCGCDISWSSSLVSKSLRSEGFSNEGVSFWELITDTWSKINRRLTE